MVTSNHSFTRGRRVRAKQKSVLAGILQDSYFFLGIVVTCHCRLKLLLDDRCKVVDHMYGNYILHAPLKTNIGRRLINYYQDTSAWGENNLRLHALCIYLYIRSNNDLYIYTKLFIFDCIVKAKHACLIGKNLERTYS